ncbi:MAG TPA: ABC transporter substrate-binding protein [Xanthobacteraceae bacterium]|nr:ABC transporter substrate-binding protein [Xanthobacteraceae bacterium]
MRRREFITLLGGATASWPLAARAQQAGERIRRIGILEPFPKSNAEVQARVQIFRQELARLGWAEGVNVQFDERWPTDNMDLLRADAANLVALNPDVILITGDRVIPILTRLTRSIPIVVAATSDPIASGAVKSLARPGGNVTGFSLIEFSIFGKMLETLKRLAPGISRVGMMYSPDNPVGAAYLRSFEIAASQLGVQPINLPIHDLADVKRGIATVAEQPNGGILFPPDVTVISLREQVVALLARYRVPAIFPMSLFTAAGGLISYGPDLMANYRQSASYVDRILRGEKPGDLPFQQPSTYRLVINLRAAKALGLTIPQTLLATADEVIE